MPSNRMGRDTGFFVKSAIDCVLQISGVAYSKSYPYMLSQMHSLEQVLGRHLSKVRERFSIERDVIPERLQALIVGGSSVCPVTE